MIVTTAGRTTGELISLSKSIATELHLSYVTRKKESILDLQTEYQSDVLVVGKNRLQFFKKGIREPFFFHPNSAMFRVKRIKNKGNDPLVEAARLKPGNSFLDCTLGLGSDSIVASFVIGSSGIVQGLEAQKMIAFMTQRGLQTWDSGLQEFNEAMKRIKVTHVEHYHFLKNLPSNSFDIIYFDPMFEEAISESNGINQLRHHAQYSKLNSEVIGEAYRVAKERIVLKDHFRSSRFQKFGFQVYKRQSAKFHFGVINKEHNNHA